MACLVVPCVLQFVYCDRGKRHLLFLAFDAVTGQPKVGLRIGRSWSGWHGHWWWSSGILHVLVHHSGNEEALVHMAFRPVVAADGRRLDGTMEGYVKGRYVIAVLQGVTTKTISQKLLMDGAANIPWLLISLDINHGTGYVVNI